MFDITLFVYTQRFACDGGAVDKLWLWYRAAKEVAKCDPRDRGAEVKQ